MISTEEQTAAVRYGGALNLDAAGGAVLVRGWQTRHA
jgi:hypothetical protein